MAKGWRNPLRHLLRLPLVVRFVGSGLVIGLLIWLVLDAYQGREVQGLVAREYGERLHELARDDRLRFDEALRSQFNLVRILADSIKVRRHMRSHRDNEPDWSAPGAGPGVEIIDRLPDWLPPRSVMREFPEPDFLVVMDARDRVREVYRARPLTPPPRLVSPDNRRLLLMSEGQPLLTRLDSMPYLLSSAVIEDAQGSRLARILAASPIDHTFLLRAQGLYLDSGHVVALAYGEPPMVMASSDPERLSPGALLSQVEEEFLVAGEAFFDYGAAEIKTSFITLIPRTELHDFAAPVLAMERGQRTALAVTLIAFFLVVLLVLSNRIRALIDRVGGFTRDVFGVATPRMVQGGDELSDLEIQFERLADEVMASRQALQAEAREKLRLLQEQMHVQAENEHLQTLHSVTDFLGVGVLRLGSDEPVAENTVMARLARECGGVRALLNGRIGGSDIVLRDLEGRERLFAVAQPAGMEAELVLVQEVTARRRAEKAIESLARFPQQAPWPILRILADGSIDQANPASATLLRTLACEEGGQVPPEWRDAVREALATRKSVEREVCVGERVLSLTLVPVPEEGCVNAYGSDVSDRKRAEAVLQDANVELERRVSERTEALRRKIADLMGVEEHLRRTKEEAEIASRVKTEFLAAMSHELRTPLNAIIGFADLMKTEVLGPLGHDSYRGYIGDILDSAHHLLDVINDILDITKIEAGRMHLRVEPVSMPGVVDEALTLVEQHAAGSNLALESEVADDLPPIHGDRRRLVQVLVNLLSNAIKFTPNGSVRALAYAAQRGVTLEVVDTGIGMDADEIRQALEPFGQVDSSLARRYDGTGLGLPLAKALVEMHGGSLVIHSRKGEGTRVVVRLPQSPPAGTAHATAAPVPFTRG